MTASLEGRIALISGGGTGIGAAIAERFAADGARVAVVGRRPGPLREVADRCGAYPVVADLTDSAQVAAAVESVVRELGGVDIVVANAGGHGFASVADTDDDAWQASLNANLTTAFLTVRAALPQLVARKGSVVVISSLAGMFAGPKVAGYTVSKHALLGLTRSLARDYGRHGVRVNTLCPGWVRTPMADGEMDEFAQHASIGSRDEAYRTVTANVPLGRAAEPAEMAAIVRFLASDEASYLTGATIIADGGAHIVDLPTIAFDAMG